MAASQDQGTFQAICMKPIVRQRLPVRGRRLQPACVAQVSLDSSGLQNGDFAIAEVRDTLVLVRKCLAGLATILSFQSICPGCAIWRRWAAGEICFQ